MSTVTHTASFLHERRLAVVLPGFVVPCAALVFWLLGGGRPASAPVDQSGLGGLNTELPGAAVSRGRNLGSKLNARLSADSARGSELAFTPRRQLAGPGLNYGLQPGEAAPDSSRPDARATAAARQLMALQRQTYAEPAPASTFHPIDRGGEERPQRSAEQDELDRSLAELELLKAEYERRLRSSPAASAPPAARRRLKPTVLQPPSPNVVSSLAGSPSRASRSGFHTLSDAVPDETANALPAVVHTDQAVVSGGTVKLRLSEEARVNGQLLPRHTLVHGQCRLTGERLRIEVRGVQVNNRLLPVSLRAYDLDGTEGLFVPGVPTGDALRQSVQPGLNAAEALALTSHAGAAAAGVALQTGKSLLGRRARQVRITLKANHQILLKP
ncbi:conjugative transposon protein TraM [Solirubrum puertoriconensis]|uniref:Conjugative transposon TraM C-terminal domain-containing protein n=1 Tax=Solirubrum puertoriconensis TaxID=1751427 RepID=A0A9X0HN71_SOLP1|nr:conjugative transposon protein TraM [Solirubrum puertoriconensis]KUG09069.1 hypothetical protein ASU33_19805 [Solirubrum puertoriconensis]